MGGERKGRPEAGDYLWAGMPWAGYLLWDHSPQWLVVPGGEVPDLSGSAVDSSDLPWVCTAIDADGNPVELAFARTGEYLFKPAYWNLNTNFDVSQPRIDVPSGMLAVTVGGEVSMRPPDMIGRRPVRAGARLVTVDASVLLAGLRPTKFRPCDAIFVSGAVVAELAMYRERYPDGDTSPIRGSSWRLSVPVPVDDRVLAVYRDLAFRVDRQDGAPAISRVDLLCVATALVYGAAMYTTDPEVYAGLGVEVLRYGETRNPDAVDRKTPRAAGKRRGSDPTRSELARSRRACSLVPVTAPLGGAGEGPAPVEYLWAGLPCPDDALRGSGRPKVVVSAGEVPDMSGWPADSEVLPWVCTAVDGDGGPVEVAFARTERFLFRPAYWNLNSRFDVSDPVRHVPSGLLEVTAGEPGPPRVSDVVGVRPVRAGARLVTVDTSVLLAGLRPEKFRPDDVLLVSMAAITEFEVYLQRLPGGGVRPARGEPWLLSTPVAVDSNVLSYLAGIAFGLQRARNPVVAG
ncbi:MAG: PIN domain-containing protein, partial [Bifidobacteriaceae bacterium]|nr:PIN domain-containing protein [Bifidobacteriaceae bacterium]